MKAIPILTAAALASLALAACDRPGTKTVSAPGTTTTTTTTVSSAPGAATTTTDTTTPNPPASSATTARAETSTAATGAGSSNVVSDTLLTGKVKAAIATDSGMKDSDISVKSENGVVTLSGTVKSPDQATLASALAQRQEGVSRVENQIAVK